MKLTHLFRILSLGLTLAVQSSVFATTTNNDIQYKTTISSDWAPPYSWIVYFAHLQTARIDTLVQHSLHPIRRGMDDFREDKERKKFNLKFQTIKQQIADELSVKEIYFTLFLEHLVIKINQNDQSGALLFDIPQMDTDDFDFRDYREIWSVEKARKAVTNIQRIIKRIDELLPSGTTPEQLSQFVFPLETSIDSNLPNIFSISSDKDSQVLLNALVKRHNQLIDKFQALLTLAEKACAEDLSQDERNNLEADYQYYLVNYFLPFPYDQKIGKVKLFNNNKLEFMVDGKIRKYFFPELSLTSTELEADDLSTTLNSFTTYFHVTTLYAWLINWTLDGTVPLLKRFAEERDPDLIAARYKLAVHPGHGSD